MRTTYSKILDVVENGDFITVDFRTILNKNIMTTEEIDSIVDLKDLIGSWLDFEVGRVEGSDLSVVRECGEVSEIAQDSLDKIEKSGKIASDE